jgi:predicted nucleotidyltransferase
MNLKLLSPIPENLIEATFPFGSRVYGTNTEHSDIDYLAITKFDTGDFPLQHQFYNGDIVYISLNRFLESLNKASNPVVFEVLHLPEFQEKYRTDIMQYYNARSTKMYLGFAKRDLDYGLDRIQHVNRCIWMAEKIMKKELINLQDVAKIEICRDVDFLKQKTKELRESLVYDKS